MHTILITAMATKTAAFCSESDWMELGVGSQTLPEIMQFKIAPGPAPSTVDEKESTEAVTRITTTATVDQRMADITNG
jgi:hypothetical protein